MPMADGAARTSRRLTILPLAVWLLLVVIGYFPTQSLGGRRGVEAMIIAQAVVVGIVYVTLIPAMRQMVIAERAQRFQIALKAGAIRFILTLLVVVVVAWGGTLNKTVFLMWVAIAYIVMIKVETLSLIHWSKRLESQQQ